MNQIQQIQLLIGATPDGIWGPKSQAAFDAIVRPVQAPTLPIVHHVNASSFADPKDVAAFKRCKATGKSDDECFRVGDNGIGKWGDDTTVDKPMCALPPEDWERFGDAARGKPVLVFANGKQVICELRDTMPHRANITNGAGIDLNPAAVAALGLHPPIMVPATWQWA